MMLVRHNFWLYLFCYNKNISAILKSCNSVLTIYMLSAADAVCECKLQSVFYKIFRHHIVSYKSLEYFAIERSVFREATMASLVKEVAALSSHLFVCASVGAFVFDMFVLVFTPERRQLLPTCFTKF